MIECVLSFFTVLVTDSTEQRPSLGEKRLAVCQEILAVWYTKFINFFTRPNPLTNLPQNPLPIMFLFKTGSYKWLHSFRFPLQISIHKFIFPIPVTDTHYSFFLVLLTELSFAGTSYSFTLCKILPFLNTSSNLDPNMVSSRIVSVFK